MIEECPVKRECAQEKRVCAVSEGPRREIFSVSVRFGRGLHGRLRLSPSPSLPCPVPSVHKATQLTGRNVASLCGEGGDCVRRKAASRQLSCSTRVVLQQLFTLGEDFAPVHWQDRSDDTPELKRWNAGGSWLLISHHSQPLRHSRCWSRR